MFVVDAAAGAAAAGAADVSAGVGRVCSVAAAQNIAIISGFPRTHARIASDTRTHTCRHTRRRTDDLALHDVCTR